MAQSAKQDQSQEKNKKKLSEINKAAIDVLAPEVYETEKEYVEKRLEFNILVCGSPRVGKSTLINVMCGQELAKTSDSLNSCTSNTEKYEYKDTIDGKSIYIYDSPGAESWKDDSGFNQMKDFILEIKPICMIFCASPGSFALTDQLKRLLEYCITQKVFCALVVTNMFNGNQRDSVVTDFKTILNDIYNSKKVSEDIKPIIESKGVTLYGEIALCTMVNSKQYINNNFPGISINMPVQGVDELLFGIMRSLTGERLVGFCYLILHNRSYVQQMQHQLSGFFTETIPKCSKYIRAKLRTIISETISESEIKVEILT